MTEIVEYLRIWQGELLPRIDIYRPFKAVVILQTPPTAEWQEAVSRWLVASGCLYMMAWGEGCSSWDDSLDCANLEAWNWEGIPDHHFVMTSWHENEPLQEVLGFAKMAARAYCDIDLLCCLLIDVGPCERKDEMITAYRRAWTG